MKTKMRTLVAIIFSATLLVACSDDSQASSSLHSTEIENSVDILGETFQFREGVYLDWQLTCSRVEGDTYYCDGSSSMGGNITYFAEVKITRGDVIVIRRYGASIPSNCNYTGRVDRERYTARGTYTCSHLPGRFRFELEY